MVLSDWTDERPEDVLWGLKREGDYYAFKKRFLPSLWGAIRHGAVWDYIKSEWARMGPMDLSDVGYDAFLINGKERSEVAEIRPGDKVRLRIIDSAASTFFYINIGNLRDFQVITKDGVAVEPVTVNEIRMGMGETYDILFKVPEGHQMGYELRATAQDLTGGGSVILGQGHHIEKVPEKVKSTNPFKMDHGDMESMEGMEGMEGHHNMESMDSHSMEGMGHHNENMAVFNRLQYSMLKSPTVTAFDGSLKRHEIDLELDGDMGRYTWYINGKPISEEKYIMVRYNEVVRVTMKNKTMMHHPMHLHGHFFRVLNGQGAYAPNFHTVDVGPMKTVVIEFWANTPGIWFFHCHNLYHMKMGMARFVKYEGFERPQELIEAEAQFTGSVIKDTDFFPRAEASIYTNHAELELGLNGGRWDMILNLELENYDEENFEAEGLFNRYLSRFLALTAGGEYEDKDLHALLGATYTAPLNVHVLSYMRTDKTAVIRLHKEIPLAPRLIFEIEPEFQYRHGFESQLEATLGYQLSNQFSLDVFYRREDDLGKAVGFGLSYRF